MKTIREYSLYAGLGLVLFGSVFVLSANAYTLQGNPPVPEVRGVPSYLQATVIGNELVRVTNEKTGRTFIATIEKNLISATYSVYLTETLSQ